MRNGKWKMENGKCIRTTGTFLLLLLLGLAAAKSTFAQYCNPVTVSYLVRDEKGQLLPAADIKTLADQLPKQIGDATTYVSEVSFGPDNQTYYWEEDVEWKNGNKTPSINFSNAGICAMHFSEITLTRNKKKMRLIFDLDIARYQQDRRPVVDSLPFQPGVFKLDLKGWTHEKEKMIPATHWKRVRAK